MSLRKNFMNHDIPAVCRFMLDYLEKVTAVMTPDDLRTTSGGMNPPGWILGHLAVVADLAGPMLQLPRKCPAKWHKAFGPTTSPGTELPEQTATEWMAAIRSGYEAILDALPNANEAVMAEPHGSALLAGTAVQTRGQLLTHLLTTHLATHVGQLSAWRRNQGHAPLF
jgi:hypothetical protein